MGTTGTSGYTATSYTDTRSGQTLSNAWVQIRQINYSPSDVCMVIVDIYSDQDAYTNSKRAVFTNVMSPVNYDTTPWNSYFDISVLNGANVNVQDRALAWLQTQIAPA